MHAHKLNNNCTSKQITFAHILTNTLYSVKEVTISAQSSMLVSTQFMGLVCVAAQPIATVHAPQHPTISGIPEWVKLDNYKNCLIVTDNCAPYDIVLPQNEILGVLEFESEQCVPLDERTVSSIINSIEQKFPKVQRKHFSCDEIAQKANLNVPSEFKQRYIDILYQQQAAISINKMGLGRPKNFTHKIHLKDNYLVYRKQFKILEAH
jgi:hypothetical protein